eukprot:Skav235427  [mRNA]  locus=scaffold473:50948:52006:- [translate_table: standard]
MPRLQRMNAAESADLANSVGCTAVVVLVTPEKIICANAGDSRAVLCRRGRPIALSIDHKPNLETALGQQRGSGGMEWEGVDDTVH